MTSSKTLFCLLAFVSLAYVVRSAPLLGLEDDEVADTAIVESTVREVRAIKPKDLQNAPARHNFHKTYDHTGEGGDIGFTRQKSDKGKKGYQLFDSFHKKDGDSYGYEKHNSFGKNKQGSSDGHAAKAYTQKKKRNNGRKGGDGKKSAKYQASDDGSSYEVNEDGAGDYEESGSEGAHYDDEAVYDDENGDYETNEEARINDSGYDKEDAANYKNPTHYAYGSGDEYNF